MSYFKDESKTMEQVAELCRWYREYKLHLTQIEVGKRLNMCSQNICRFEHGEVNSMRILLFYLAEGLDINKLKEVLNNGKTKSK